MHDKGADILPLILPLFQKAQKILFFICTGSHSSQTPSNDKIIQTIQAHASEVGIMNYEIISHDCQTSPVTKAGTTQHNTEILYNSCLDDVEVFLAVSDVKHHYFAGYSNPVKNMVPGLCAFKTIEQNHSLTFDERSRAGVHPWHPNSSRRDNPLAADQLEAMQLIVGYRPVWALTTITFSGIIEWADFGVASLVSPLAFKKADKWNARAVKPVDYMVISPGGLPHDVDLYIAQRALELTASAVQDGGQILFLASCPGGIGSERTKEHFEKNLMKKKRSILAQRRNKYHLFEHKPYRFMKLIDRLKTVWFYTSIPPSTVTNIHLKPCNEPQDVIDSWLVEKPDARILVVDEANKLLLTRGA